MMIITMIISDATPRPTIEPMYVSSETWLPPAAEPWVVATHSLRLPYTAIKHVVDINNVGYAAILYQYALSC